MSRYDLVILGGTAVLPGLGPLRLDLGVKDGRIAALADDLRAADGESVIDARGRHVLPGAVDSHFHVGIYRPHAEDARSESTSAVSGGVTTLVSYFRTGHHYLNKSGPYREIFPEVLQLSDGNFYCDYGYHIAPMTTAQLDEIPWLVEQGVASFKYYMFYKGLTLSADSTRGRDYTMADEYDLGHLYEMMARVSEAARERAPRRISVSLHCENPELIRVFIQRVKQQGLTGLRAYSEGRPPLSERLSIQEAGVLADATSCAVNLLHLSSRDAIEAGVDVRRRHPELDVVLETTLHHLCLSYEGLDLRAKVNPPIRTPADQDALWRHVLNGEVDTVVSDHACCMEEMKRGDTWTAMPGFGGSSLLYPVLLSEGVRKRGMRLERAVELCSTNPARHFGLYPRKGTLAVGCDADLALVDLQLTRKVSVEGAHSAQDHTPFAGVELTGWPRTTILRGQPVFDDGRLVGEPRGQFVKRPVA